MNDSSALPLPQGFLGTSGGDEAVRWEVITNTPGLLPAQVIAGRLEAAGIPARAWQQAAGQAFGLVVGPMGTGYVVVPDDYADQARTLLEELRAEWEAEWDEEEWEEE